MKSWGIGIAVIGCLALGSQAQDGKALYTKHQCHTCHGENGAKPILPVYPKLAGQNADYLNAQLLDIKSGKRNNGMTAAMKVMVTKVPDADFKAISKWLEKMK